MRRTLRSALVRGAIVVGALGATLAVGCGFDAAVFSVGEAGVGEAGAHPEAGAGGYCLGDTSVGICLSAPPTAPLTIGADVAIDTDTSPACSSNVTGADKEDYCVVAATSITIMGGKTLSASGSRPLVLLASGTITVMGTIDVAGHVGGKPQSVGPGGDAACSGSTAATSGGGGFGGSLGALGAAGGGDDDGATGGLPPLAVPSPARLRGGCAGGNGTGGGGAGGHSGGGVALIAGTAIQIAGSGVINASGGGGSGSQVNNTGGGGGGSGGMIVLDAPTVTAMTGAKICANGGSGGEGSASNNGNDGADAPPDPTMAAKGAKGGGSGGDGGDGSKANGLGANAPTAGVDATNNNGGGGGGGGAGIVQEFKATALGGIVSPPPT